MMFLQQAAQAVVANPMDPSLLPAQFTASTFIVWLIDLLKRAKWFPWMNADTSGINRTVAIVGAALTAAGIHFAMESQMVEGRYVITITGATLGAIWHFAQGFGVSIASQQTILKLYQIVNLLRKSTGG